MDNHNDSNRDLTNSSNKRAKIIRVEFSQIRRQKIDMKKTNKPNRTRKKINPFIYDPYW